LRRAIGRVRAHAPSTVPDGTAATRRAPLRALRAHDARCAPARFRFEIECVKQAVSVARMRIVAGMRACFGERRGRLRRRRAVVVAARRRRHAGEFFSPGLLTSKKTVISFRPSRGDLRTRVSRATGTTRSTKKPSALERSKVDSGSVSLEKRANTLRTDDLHRRAMRVFCCQESVPARLARRRLLAGPTPAAFQTGLLYP